MCRRRIAGASCRSESCSRKIATMTDDQKRQIVSRLDGRSHVDAFEAAREIWDDPEGFERPLLQVLRHGTRPFNRIAAAFAMQIVTTGKTIRALERALRDEKENSRVRGHAAEALAHAHRQESHRILRSGLRDPSKEIRFWCAFALGEMADERAIPALEDLAKTDKRVVRGFHSVAKEASDALENIRIGNRGHRRKRGCIFCLRS